jgi:sugar transferase (PEP-CTERM/EpsH1 system associated)
MAAIRRAPDLAEELDLRPGKPELLAFDRRLARSADASILVSEQEAALFRSLAPESAERIFGIGNGIDAGYFAPEAAYPPVIPKGRPAIVFTGAMDYWPNIDAVSWFVAEILPRVRQRVDAAFYIVGSNPAPQVLGLAAHEGVHVTGRVEDVRPYLAQAAAAVAPMRVARGIQNKVLEAMAMARPVVTTPQGLEGIEAVAQKHLLVAEDAETFATSTAQALLDPHSGALGREARSLIVERFSWGARLAAVDKLIGSTPMAA